MKSRIVSSVLVPLVLCFMAGGVSAQSTYPEKPIEAICAYRAGSGHDIASRVMAEFMPKYIGQPVIIANKPGGSGSIAGNYLIRAKSDGYTLGFFNEVQVTPEHGMTANLFQYTSKDLQPVARWSGGNFAVFVKYDAPWKSAKEFVEYCKQNPDKLRWGHTGVGNRYWLSQAMFKQITNIKVLEVPFQGDNELLSAILGNHIEVSVMGIGGVTIAQLQAKTIRPLFTIEPNRSPLLPDVPTADELGYVLNLWEPYLATFVTKGTPPEIVSKLSSATKRVCEDPQFKEKMNNVWWPVKYIDTKEFEEMVAKNGKAIYDIQKKFGFL
jgi:tripartite-type tricarboxylate transporter receptor subunit TctC